ncbi:TPA: hypothetical protein PIS85_002317 [Staphylococcus aureus]|uniref:hypothetical protein n=1 Tax=Staphylococcus aureus TaxID=1280 RepID=UPI0037E07CDB|nr:hypothetical protein [Staphylococcus aureus]HDH1977786.1 hypothetical protein [Staphylococcus aureus]
MPIFIMFLVVLVLLIAMRTLKNHYITKKLKDASQSNIADELKAYTHDISIAGQEDIDLFIESLNNK